jgi:tRNA(Ile)-lysidine synthase
VLVAVSGGADSVVLLHLLKHLPPKLRPELVAAHFNHRLRGKASDADARFVRGLCHAWGIPFRTAQAPRWRTRENVEARARELRYRFLGRVARRSGIGQVAVAHHADDQLETFAMRWLQGAGLKGLAGMRPRRGLEALEGASESRVELIRPLLGATRKEIQAYARAWRLSWREDATNRSDLFLRSRLRKLLRSLERENPNLAERTALNAVFLQADEDFLDGRISSIFQRFAEKSSRRIGFPLLKYRLMPGALRYRLLQKLAQAVVSETTALPAAAVLKVDEILRDSVPSQHYDLPAGLGLEKGPKHFVFFRKSPKNRIDSRQSPCYLAKRPPQL